MGELLSIDPQAARQPSYRDKQLGTLMKELRGAVRSLPLAKQALERVEQRLRYVLRVVELWDHTHAERAELLIRLGNLPAANTAASLVFDEGRRHDLLRQTNIGLDATAADRLAEAVELGREVLA